MGLAWDGISMGLAWDGISMGLAWELLMMIFSLSGGFRPCRHLRPS